MPHYCEFERNKVVWVHPILGSLTDECALRAAGGCISLYGVTPCAHKII